MNSISILWADDEIDLLKSHILFLEKKGYNVTPVTNGQNAIDECASNKDIDVVFLDENMPGLSGLETLTRIKELHPNLPVVMITKSEEENIMEDAIGSQISDYLIKPVNPNQILLTLKKLTEHKRLIKEKTTSSYQQDFQKIFSSLGSELNSKEWVELYKKLIFWELELEKTRTKEMAEVYSMQKEQANAEFYKYINKYYAHWLKNPEEGPILSHQLLEKKLLPHIDKQQSTFFLLIDNLRFDQWKVIQPYFNELFKLQEEETFFSILPTTTQYSRNAIFSGLLPLEIEKKYPQYWRYEEDEGGKNDFEDKLLETFLIRNKQAVSFSYTKITNQNKGKELEDTVFNLLNNQLNVIVYNFVDMLSHARTEMEVLRELAPDEAAYRSITQSWFLHSSLYAILQKLSEKSIDLIVATDHGTIRVKQPSKVVGEKDTTTNPRYKHGKNLQYNSKDCLEIKNPHDISLPKSNISTKYIFAREDKYFVYPNNYNHYVNFYKNTFQHGGISLEEMIIPVIRYTSK